jgi:hypothetical protein
MLLPCEGGGPLDVDRASRPADTVRVYDVSWPFVIVRSWELP